MHIPLIVVGAGIAGLRVASQCGVECLVLEGSSRVGGRAWTERDKHGRPLYDAGAWRVHSSHARFIRLCELYNIKLRRFEGDPKKKPPPGKWATGLSKLDVGIMSNGGNVLKAVAADLKTGYSGTSDAAAGTHPYDSAEQGEYYIIADGFDSVTTAMAHLLPSNATLRLNTSVTDVTIKDGVYMVDLLHRPDPKGACERQTITCSRLVLAVPPRAFKSWSVAKFMRPVLASVREHSLHHIYAKLKQTPTPQHLAANRRGVFSALAQQIKPTLDWAWSQVSYSAGPVADFWNRVKLTKGASFVAGLVREWGGGETRSIKSHYWSCGYHVWQPVPFFDETKTVRLCAEPDPNNLPRLYVCGEAFSAYQGWSEGALQTADLVLNLLDGTKGEGIMVAPQRDQMVLDGRVLEVKAWARTHPGSRTAIVNHLGEDVSLLFRHIVQHSELSWAVLLSLQIGFKREY